MNQYNGHSLSVAACSACGDLDGCHLARLLPIMREVTGELSDKVLQCETRWGKYASLHEVYGVLAEEFIEFQEQVFLKQELRDPAVVEAELFDIAQVAIRAALQIRANRLRIGK